MFFALLCRFAIQKYLRLCVIFKRKIKFLNFCVTSPKNTSDCDESMWRNFLWLARMENIIHNPPINIWHFFVSRELTKYATSNALWLVDSKVTLVVNKEFVSRQQIVPLYISLVPISSCADKGFIPLRKRDKRKKKRVPNTLDREVRKQTQWWDLR